MRPLLLLGVLVVSGCASILGLDEVEGYDPDLSFTAPVPPDTGAADAPAEANDAASE